MIGVEGGLLSSKPLASQNIKENHILDTLIQLIIDIIPGIVIAVIVSLVSVRLSIRRFYSERWWERKAEAYSSIVEQLYHVLNDLGATLRALERGQEITDSKHDQLQKEAQKALRGLYKAESIGSFIISADAAESLSQMRERLDEIPYDQDLYSLVDARYEVVSKCFSKIKQLAKKELAHR